jgi:hypothetical protein
MRNLLKNHLHWYLFLFALVALVVSVTMARSEDFGSRAAFLGLQARARGGLDAHWDNRTGVPDFIAGKDAITALPYTPSAAERGNPAAMARGFLDENRALFKLTSASEQLNVLRVESDAQLGYAHVRVAQMFNGIPVFGKQLVVHLDARENIVAVNGQFTPDINVATQPSITPDDAERVALQDLRGRLWQSDPDVVCYHSDRFTARAVVLFRQRAASRRHASFRRGEQWQSAPHVHRRQSRHHPRSPGDRRRGARAERRDRASGARQRGQSV